MTEVLIADDHAVVRSGLRQFLASTDDLKIVAEACTGKEALDKIEASRCDVLLLDINLPDLNGLEVLKRAKYARPDLPVLVFSMFSEDEFAMHALNAGASGYLNKDSPPAQILLALRTVASGARYVSPALADKLLSGTLPTGKSLPHQSLSEREREVMLALTRGIALTKIADQLNLSVKTVSTYRTRVLEKLKLNSNAKLIRYVLEHKLDG